MPTRPIDWTAQDWLLIARCLAEARWLEDVDDDRAYELLRGVAADQHLSAPELVLQDPRPR